MSTLQDFLAELRADAGLSKKLETDRSLATAFDHTATFFWHLENRDCPIALDLFDRVSSIVTSRNTLKQRLLEVQQVTAAALPAILALASSGMRN